MNKFYFSLFCTMSMAALLFFSSCRDDWDNHYDADNADETANETLYAIIASHPELGDFREVLDSTRLFSNNRVTTLYFQEILDGDQFYTVWAPKNGSFNKDSLLALCCTEYGDSLVELHFLKNHIARYRHSSGGTGSESVVMLNKKNLVAANGKLNNSKIDEANIKAKNGILHLIESPVEYHYSIFEALSSIDDYRHIGTFLESYQTEEFDETSSLATGVVDGKTVYIDSVFTIYNPLFNRLGYLNREDSLYWMLVPTKQLWDSLYTEAETYYNYCYLEKGDSIHYYWSNYALMQDLVYNPHTQLSLADSITSTTYLWNDYHYHVYYTPFAEGGLFSHFDDSLICCNGVIYSIDKWPFVKEKSYFIPIQVEAEGRVYKDYETATKSLTLTRQFISSDSVSEGYLSVKPQTAYDEYYLIYEIPGVLSGEYDVCVVMLPKTVLNPQYTPENDKKQFRPNKFGAEITYMGTDGKEYSVNSNTKYLIDESSAGYYVKSSGEGAEFLFNCNQDPQKANTRAFTNDPYRVDTIRLATIKFPTCNYGQQNVTTRIQITNSIKSNQTNTYNSEMFIDCFYLKPHMSNHEE